MHEVEIASLIPVVKWDSTLTFVQWPVEPKNIVKFVRSDTIVVSRQKYNYSTQTIIIKRKYVQKVLF